MNAIVQILMERDLMSHEHATNALIEARARVYEEFEHPEDVLMEDLGLEPDYLFDLLD